MGISCGHLLLLLLFSALSFFSPTHVFSMQPRQATNYEGSSELVDLVYHMGPVLASPINLYIIWYGHWSTIQQAIIRDFLHSLSALSSSHYPSVADWWSTVRLYTDQTGANITGDILLSGEHYDWDYSHGKYLTRLDIQYVIKAAAGTYSGSMPLDTHNGLYLVLTSPDVSVQDFCRAVCGFHYFTFPLIAGATVPYAWVGHSGSQCPGTCAYPFALPKFVGGRAGSLGGRAEVVMGAPNGDVGTDGMISVIAHELAEMASNPLINAWYAGDDPTAPTEIADLCVGVYGSGGGGGYVGMVYRDSRGRGYNVNGVKGRRFMVQWVWNPAKNRCFGPNALD